jgi:hypothetical protein
VSAGGTFAVRSFRQRGIFPKIRDHGDGRQKSGSLTEVRTGTSAPEAFAGGEEEDQGFADPAGSGDGPGGAADGFHGDLRGPTFAALYSTMNATLLTMTVTDRVRHGGAEVRVVFAGALILTILGCAGGCGKIRRARRWTWSS